MRAWLAIGSLLGSLNFFILQSNLVAVRRTSCLLFFYHPLFVCDHVSFLVDALSVSFCLGSYSWIPTMPVGWIWDDYKHHVVLDLWIRWADILHGSS